MVIPALNEEATVARVVNACLADAPYEILVLDADSTDATAGEAARAGARLVNWGEVLPQVTPVPGKGESLWRGVAAASGDVVVFVDADLDSAEPGMVNALAAPFQDPDIHLVKAHYERTLDGRSSGGGRVTELTAKPLLSLFFPELGDIFQPLGGEYAVRRDSALRLPFVADYGVEVGLLIDVWRDYGRASIAQVPLAPRRHRNKPLEQLSPMARVVAQTILTRAGAAVPAVAERGPLADIL